MSAIRYVIIFIMYVGVQADIDEGKFVPKAPVIAVGDIHSSKVVKVFIVFRSIVS